MLGKGGQLKERDVLPPWGWSGGAMVLCKLPVPGPTISMIVGQGPTALVVSAGGGCLDIFTLIYLYCALSSFLWETARYSLKYCLKGPLNPKQPANQSPSVFHMLCRRYTWLLIRTERNNKSN